MTVQPLLQPHFGEREHEVHRPRWASVAVFAALVSVAVFVVRYLRTRLDDPSAHVTFEDELGG